MRILVTGGTGYIGSHTCLQLLKAGHDVVVIDNLSNSKLAVLDCIQQICGRKPVFYKEDLLDNNKVSEILSVHGTEAVMHFAGLKSVGESVALPLIYYKNNVAGSLSLVSAMKASGVRTLVFSSSATVYGNPLSLPIHEDFPLGCTNTYGRSKLMVEKILHDLILSDDSWKIAMLRYFNPVGAHESGLIGEDPTGIPNNLMPYISHVAAGRLTHLQVYGGDYPTPDGTGIRDYIHVVDLAYGHTAALDWLKKHKGVHTFNLGTGRGSSVLEVVRAFESVTGQHIPYRIVDRRLGDIAQCYADVSQAEKKLGWKAQRSIKVMCKDAWNWQVMNPKGYETKSH
jgi:UDP-glucose 4-epimerase